jgi:hypothetical protein
MQPTSETRAIILMRCLTDSVQLRRINNNRALDVSDSERLRAFHSSADSFNAC